MSRLLRIDASSRTEGSYSRALADIFEQVWRERHAGAEVMRRDLAAQPVPHIASETITGFYTPAEKLDGGLRQALALSDRLIAELKSAEAILLSTPMYNFSVPSALKAYVDHIVRIGHTFAYDGKSFTGLLAVKRAFVVSAYGAGGYHDAQALGSFNFLEPYLRLLFTFLGIGEVTFFSLEATTGDAAAIAAGRARADQEIRRAVAAA